jgi:hypothetical protein
MPYHCNTPSYSSDRSRLETLSSQNGKVLSFDEARSILSKLDISHSGPVRVRVKLVTDDDWKKLMYAAHAVREEEGEFGVWTKDLTKVLDHLYHIAFCIPIARTSSSFDEVDDGNSSFLAPNSGNKGSHHRRIATSTF